MIRGLGGSSDGRGKGIWRSDKEPVTVHLQFTAYVTPYVKETIWHPEQTILLPAIHRLFKRRESDLQPPANPWPDSLPQSQ